MVPHGIRPRSAIDAAHRQAPVQPIVEQSEGFQVEWVPAPHIEIIDSLPQHKACTELLHTTARCWRPATVTATMEVRMAVLFVSAMSRCLKVRTRQTHIRSLECSSLRRKPSRHSVCGTLLPRSLVLGPPTSPGPIVEQSRKAFRWSGYLRHTLRS